MSALAPTATCICCKVFTQVGGNGLLTRPGLGLGDVDDKLLQVDVLTPNAQNLGLAHRGIQPDLDEGMNLAVLVASGHFHQPLDLLHRQLSLQTLTKPLQNAVAVDWAKKRGVAEGYGDGRLGVDETLTVGRFLGFLRKYDDIQKMG